jgi:hypothetical protein
MIYCVFVIPNKFTYLVIEARIVVDEQASSSLVINQSFSMLLSPVVTYKHVKIGPYFFILHYKLINDCCLRDCCSAKD